MLIRFHEISPHGNHYEIHEIDGLATQQDFIIKGPVNVYCTLKRKGEAKVELHGSLKATLTLVCDRCLELYDMNIDSEMQAIFVIDSGESWHLKELECSAMDLESILLDEPVIDLDDVLRQQLYLALPMKGLCSEHCKGLCLQCGAQLNAAPCRCSLEHRESPFAALARLKK